MIAEQIVSKSTEQRARMCTDDKLKVPVNFPGNVFIHNTPTQIGLT